MSVLESGQSGGDWNYQLAANMVFPNKSTQSKDLFNIWPSLAMICMMGNE
jgi:hypothetical protein